MNERCHDCGNLLVAYQRMVGPVEIFCEWCEVNPPVQDEPAALQALAAPVYVSLHTGDPNTHYCEVHEVPYGYTRQPIKFSLPHKGRSVNTDKVSFSFDGDCPAISHFAIFDAPVGGTRLFSSILDSRVKPQAGDILEFLPGSVTVSI